MDPSDLNLDVRVQNLEKVAHTLIDRIGTFGEDVRNELHGLLTPSQAPDVASPAPGDTPPPIVQDPAEVDPNNPPSGSTETSANQAPSPAEPATSEGGSNDAAPTQTEQQA